MAFRAPFRLRSFTEETFVRRESLNTISCGNMPVVIQYVLRVSSRASAGGWAAQALVAYATLALPALSRFTDPAAGPSMARRAAMAL